MLTTHIMRNNTILLQMQAVEYTTAEMAKNKTKNEKTCCVQMLTTETMTTRPPLVVALVDVVAGQTGKASEGSSHEKVADFSQRLL